MGDAGTSDALPALPPSASLARSPAPPPSRPCCVQLPPTVQPIASIVDSAEIATERSVHAAMLTKGPADLAMELPMPCEGDQCENQECARPPRPR